MFESKRFFVCTSTWYEQTLESWRQARNVVSTSGSQDSLETYQKLQALFPLNLFTPLVPLASILAAILKPLEGNANAMVIISWIWLGYQVVQQ